MYTRYALLYISVILEYRERKRVKELPSAHAWVWGTKGLLKYMLTHSYTHSRGLYKAICYCNCVNEAGDILHPSCSVLGLKGSSFVLLSPLFVLTLILIHTHKLIHTFFLQHDQFLSIHPRLIVFVRLAQK